MRRGLLAAGLALLLLAGCAPAPAPTGDRAEFDAFCQSVNGARAQNLAWTADERAELAHSMTEYSAEDGLTEEELTALFGPRENGGTGELNRAALREDVDLFFRALRAAYGGYDYFGGDEVFTPIQEELYAYLDRHETFVSADLRSQLTHLLRPVIRDGHFAIGNKPIIERESVSMFYVPDLYLQDTSGLDGAYVKPTIGPDGRLAYCFAALARSGKELPDKLGEYDLAWVEAERYAGRDRMGYRRTQVEGIPALVSRTMTSGATTASGRELEAFASAGAEYRGLPLLLVDIRGNGGGNSSYAGQWMEGFARQIPQLKIWGGTKCSPLFLYGLQHSELYAAVQDSIKNEMLDYRGSWEIDQTDGIRGETDTLVFVLTDQGTCSAAEDFVAILRMTENVVFVGSNTQGSMMFGNVMPMTLPNTGLPVRFGASIHFWEGTGNTEGVGFLPDLWVNPVDAEDAVVRLCRYYGLI